MSILKMHGNCNMKPIKKIPVEAVVKVKGFLTGIMEQEGEVIATSTYKRKLTDGKVVRYMELDKIVYLPSHPSYRTIYKMYCVSIGLSELEAPVSFTKFYGIWKSSKTLRFMKIHKASKNVCYECTILRNVPNGQMTLESEVSEHMESNELTDLEVGVSEQNKQEMRL
ncbi:hypothetical protein HOY82DRAFT_535459 [Tuber indicum]|nr:hypothetical protein HOY82DRAFT_535459 [Tuber indicum]